MKGIVTYGFRHNLYKIREFTDVPNAAICI